MITHIFTFFCVLKELEFDPRYVLFQIEAEVEVYSEPDFIKLIVGGSLGGLVLLALITAGLFKVIQFGILPYGDHMSNICHFLIQLTHSFVFNHLFSNFCVTLFVFLLSGWIFQE